MSTTRGDRGAVLVLVLLLLVALTLVAHGSLYLARQELSVARASVRNLRSRMAAEGVIRGVVAGWPSEAEAMPVGSSLAAGSVELDRGVSGVATVRRLGRELFLVQAEGRQDGWAGATEAARLVWAVDAGAVLQGFGAVAEVGGSVRLDPGSGIDGSGVTDPPPGWDGVCEPLSEELQGLLPGGSLSPVRGVPSGPDPPPGAGPRLLGPLTATDLLPRADLVPSSPVTPAPSVRFGACDGGDRANWGSPDDSGGACGERLPLIVAPGDLVVDGGRGQGVLVVGGSLRLAPGARFRGLVLVAGDLTLEADVRIRGLVRALGNLELLDDARITGSGCPVLRALRGASGLAGAAPLPIRSWISPF